MPRRSLCASLIFAFLLSVLLVPATTHGTPASHLLITEVLYDPAAIEPGAEWVELFNPTGAGQNLAGWALRDNSSSDALPDFVLEGGQYVVITANRDEFLAANPGYGGPLIALGSPIGNGLSNSGDALALLDPAGAVIDGMSYGGDSSLLNPPCPDVAEGTSLGRYPSDADTDSAADWLAAAPTPGSPTTPPPPTATVTEPPTATPSATPSPTSTATPTRTPTFTATPTAHDPDETPTPTSTVTASATATPTLTTVPWPALLLSEIYADAPQTGSEGKYEWVEIFNPTGAPVVIKGWKLADNSSADALPDATIPAHGYLIVAATRDGFIANFPLFAGDLVSLEGTIGNGLSNTGDRVRLLAPNDVVVDEMSYGDDKTVFDPACPAAKPGESLARVPSDADTDRAADWMRQDAPNPGEAGVPPTPTPTATFTLTPAPVPTDSPTVTLTPTNAPAATRTATVTPTATRTRASTRTPTATRAPTRTPSPTPIATPTVGGEWPRVLLSEVLYDAHQEGSDGDWEWVELLNSTNAEVTLAGWMLADSAGQDRLPAISIGRGERVVIAAREAAFRANHPSFAGQLVPLDAPIGNGLSNTGDSVKLLAPDGTVVDAMSYGSDKSVFDPACKDVRAGQSLGRMDGPDTDAAADWTAQAEPNPGLPSALSTPTPTGTSTVTVTPTAGTPTVTPTATATPTATPLPPETWEITLNEVLPDPASIDWDRDGEASFADEWLELRNGADKPVSLAGWTISDETSSYTLPAGLVIWPRSYLLLFRTQTRLSLSDWRDTITLTRNDGTLADQFRYERGPGDDRSFCRLPDGTGAWTVDCDATPGEVNRARPAPPPGPPPPPHRTPTPTKSVASSVRAARSAAIDTRVSISGTVTFPSGLIARNIYVQDATGGMRVYLRKGEFPPLKVGDKVSMTGWTRDFHGEMEISMPDPSYLTFLGAGKPVAPRLITAKEFGEAREGEFAQVIGAVTKFSPLGLTLQDRAGKIELYFPESLGWRRPYVRIGDLWAAQGVLSQYQSERGPGYRLIPRFKSDIAAAPLGLPVTGGTQGAPRNGLARR